jgi:hypothetical protein
MRRAVVLLGLLLASGCAGDDETATETVTVTTATTVTITETVTETAGGTGTTTTTAPPGTWTGLPQPLPAGGELPVDAFNAYAESVDEPWERDVRGTVDEYVGFDEVEVANVAFQATSSGPSTNASLTLDGLFDDSVRSLRYDLTLSQRQDGTWRIESAQWAQRCQEGRGHQVFSPELCL